MPYVKLVCISFEIFSFSIFTKKKKMEAFKEVTSILYSDRILFI